ncbi:MAG TPA: hypothetical protein VGM10_26500 [Actinocrinis sp.]
MSAHPAHGGPSGLSQDPQFAALMAEATAGADRFGHREHVKLTWLAVRRHGVTAAHSLVREGIRLTARYAGAPQKYHETVSRAWVEAIGHHIADDDAAAGSHGADDGFAAFADRHPALLDKRLLARHYRSATLASAEARTGWVEPDLAPFPWQDAVWLPARPPARLPGAHGAGAEHDAGGPEHQRGEAEGQRDR